MKLPSFQFYPGDWLKDPGLRRASHATKGVWIDILCIMFECDQRGVLATAGQAWTEEEIIRAVGGDRDVTLFALRELLRLEIAKINKSGAIICRRMVRDEEIRKVRQISGRLGGNPHLLNQKAINKNYLNQKLSKTQAKVNQSPNQNPTPSSSSSSSSSIEDKKEKEYKEKELKKHAEEEIQIPESLNTKEFRDELEEYYVFRRQTHKTCSPIQRKMVLKKLAKYDVSIAIQALDDAMAGGWDGVFPESVKLRGNGGKPIKSSEDGILEKEKLQEEWAFKRKVQKDKWDAERLSKL